MTRLGLLATTAVVGGVLAATSASAACVGSLQTCAQVTVSAGSGLSASVSTGGQTVTLTGGSLLAGATVSGDLGTTTVTETRGSGPGWTASISVEDFAHSNGTDEITSDNASVQGLPTVANGALPVTCGLGVLAVRPAPTLTRNGTTGVSSGTLATCIPVLSTGAHTAAWKTSLSLAIPGTAVAGTYTSTVTQSVL